MFPQLILIATCFVVLDQFATDFTSIATNSTGHQLVFLCRSVSEEKSQLHNPLLSR